MPSVYGVLQDTMLWKAGGGLHPLTPDAPISAPEPNPTVSQDHAIRLQNPVWSWTHDPDHPSVVSNIKSKVLGMNMNYAHSMLVCTKISLDEVQITTAQGAFFVLQLDKSFVMMKFKIDSGSIFASFSSGLWRLDTNVDQSILIVFGYQISGGNVVPFTRDQATQLGNDAMPDPGQEAQPVVAIGQQKQVLISPLRILVAFEVVCCKERNDFEPGGILGANRIYPHVMIMASQRLRDPQVTVTVTRPANTTPAHPSQEMKTAIGPILTADTNLPRGNTIGPPLPEWDNIFDYYEMDPIGQGVTNLVMVDGDPNSTRSQQRRVAQRLIMKEKSISPAPVYAFYDPVDLVKVPRQGDFDNLHMAPKMSIPPLGNWNDPQIRAALRMDDVVMAPFCVHDCLHMHVRWGEPLVNWLTQVFTGPFPDSNKGFDVNNNPNTTPGNTMVPINQTVRLQLNPPAEFTYEARAHGIAGPGRWQVFFHHGMAYANEIWEPAVVDKARIAMELTALKGGEQDFNRGQPLNTPSLNALDFWSVFYWRLRWGGAQNTPMERLGILVPSACRSL
jgi:hypothetical protein